MKPIVAAVALALAGLTASCTEATPPTKTPAAATILQAPAPTACPLGVASARVQFEESANGGTLTFLADADRVEDLRERARDAAAQHGPGQKVGKGHDGKHGNGGVHGLRAMQMPAAYTAEDDVEGGARIRFTAVDPQETEALRAKLRARAEEMNTNCD